MTQAESVSPAVVVSEVSKSFGRGPAEVEALVAVSLEVGQGEHLAVIGPSGSGKSTLLHLIAGLTNPSAGRISVGGRDLADMTDRELTLFRRRHVGMVFQAYNLVPTLTVADNVRLPLLLERGRADGRARLDALLDALGLADRRHHRPDQLSGGEQQRVAIGRAMISDPTVILADEPTGNLDSASGQRLCQLMRRLRQERGRTLITVTHDPAVAIWADRVTVLKDGRAVETLDTSAFATARDLGGRFLEVLESEREAGACA